MAPKLSREIVTFTPKLALEFMKMETVRNERDLSRGRLRHHLGLLRDGRFFSSIIAKAHCKEDGQTYRVNGQHVSHVWNWCTKYPNIPDDVKALCGFRSPADVPKLPKLEAMVDEWECDTYEDVVEAFRYYDASESVRSRTDILSVAAGEYEELQGVPGPMLNQLLSGIAYYDRWIKTQGDALLGVEDLHVTGAKSRPSLLKHKEVRDYIVWFLDMPEDIRILARNVVASGWVVDEFVQSEGECARKLLAILEEDENQEGPGYDIMSLIRKQCSRDSKSMKNDALLRRIRKFSKLVEVE